MPNKIDHRKDEVGEYDIEIPTETCPYCRVSLVSSEIDDISWPNGKYTISPMEVMECPKCKSKWKKDA